MQSRELTSSTKVITQLTAFQLPYSSANAALPVLGNAQDQLNQIADQASNFGYGCGVALKKAIDNVKKICNKLEKQLNDSRPGFFDYFYSSNTIYTWANDAILSQRNEKVVKECQQYVSEMEEDLKNLGQPKRSNNPA